MEAQDIELIKKHAKENKELDRLYKEHLRLEAEIEKLQSIRIRSQEEERELKRLKRIKLNGRDQMEAIFQHYR